MSLQLVVIAGPDKDRVFTLHPGNDNMMGRSAQVLYQLTDGRVSRSHCQIVRAGDEVTVMCTGGSGGTRVNNKIVQKQSLRVGDILHVGDTQLRLEIGDLPLDAGRDAPPRAAQAAGAARPDSLEALSGRTLAHFDVGPVIGTGSTSMVFAANDTKDNRPVALKVLLPEFSKNDEDLQRFVRAMKTALPLQHPNLVRVYAAGKAGKHCWVSMEYVAGENMTQVIQRTGVGGMLDWRYAYKVAVHVGRALVYAHAQTIIHRNVTPKNILLEATTKTVKLTDLMKAKALEGSSAQPLTRPGQLIGEILYMSPERTRGGTDVDLRADLYGLGATAYALLTGRPPFDGATLVEKITRIRQDEPVKPTKYQMSIQSGFEAIVLKCLAKRPEDRYASATEMLAQLDRVGKLHGVKV